MLPLASAAIGSPEVERFRGLLARRLGLLFDDSKLAFLADVLRRRMEATGEEPEPYLTKLESGPVAEEAGSLAQDLTVPETYFFRNIDQFRALAQLALPERVRAQRAWRSLRILSAGCASGEEAFSLAIVARQSLPDPSWEVSIRAVDINPAALERATLGRFTAWALRETPAEERRWFRPEGRDWALDESVRRAVRFERRNLAQDDPELWPAGAYDVVFCRNVVMYFAPESAQALIARISASLAPGGYLFLGHAETLRGLSHDFHLRHTHGTFYYQLKDGSGRAASGPAEAPPGSTFAAPALVSLVNDSTSWVEAIQHASDRIRALTAPPGPAPRAPAPLLAKADLRSAFEFVRSERFAEALEVVRRLPGEAKRDPDALLLEAVLLTHGGKLRQAEEVCARLLANDELSAGAHYVLALCREAGGDRGAASDHDQVAIYLDPTFAMPRLHLGLLARRAGDLGAARRELEQALLLVQREDASRLLLFGGGFAREALVALCVAELGACGGGG